MVSKKDLYNTLELRFKKEDQLHLDLYKYLEEKGRIIGKDKYLLQLLYEDYIRNNGDKSIKWGRLIFLHFFFVKSMKLSERYCI